MSRRNWETPKLLVLVRTAAEDGILQAQICKFMQLTGPGDIGGPAANCAIPPNGIPTCLATQPS